MTDEKLIDRLLRGRFDEIAADIPDRAAIETQVAALTYPQRRGRLLLARAVVVVIILGSFVSLTALWINGVGPGETAFVDSSLPEEAGDPGQPKGRPFSSAAFGEQVELVLPDVPRGRWTVETESPSMIELWLDLDDSTAENESVVRLITIPDLSSTEVADQLIAGLFDTNVVASRTVQLGQTMGTEFELMSRMGTNHAAFRLGPATYVEAIGINRRYLVRIIDRPAGAFVLWMDTDENDYFRSRAEADRLATSITFG